MCKFKTFGIGALAEYFFMIQSYDFFNLIFSLYLHLHKHKSKINNTREIIVAIMTRYKLFASCLMSF